MFTQKKNTAPTQKNTEGSKSLFILGEIIQS